MNHIHTLNLRTLVDDIYLHAFNLRTLVDDIHQINVEAGWWADKHGKPLQDNPLAFSNKLCLVHSELSEALEGDRKNTMDSHLPHRTTVEVELADALIRLLDLAGAYNLDIAGAMIEKIEYNALRNDHKAAARNAACGKAY